MDGAPTLVPKIFPLSGNSSRFQRRNGKEIPEQESSRYYSLAGDSGLLKGESLSVFPPQQSLPEALRLIELYWWRNNQVVISRENIFTLVPFYGSKVWG